MLKRLYIFSFIFLTVQYLPAQTWQWAKGGKGCGEIHSVCNNLHGDVFSVGDGTGFTFSTTHTLSGTGSFITKYTSGGNFVWARGVFGSDIYLMSVQCDPSGNIYTCGTYKGSSFNFGYNSNITTYTVPNSVNGGIILFKCDPSGNLLWYQTSSNGFGGSGDIANSVCTDQNGNAYITGYYSSSQLSFGSYTLTNSGGSSMFIAKYLPNGSIHWVKKSNGTIGTIARSICSDQLTGVYVAGSSCAPQLTLGSYTLTNSGSWFVYYAKYDTNGNVIWAQNSTPATGANGQCYGMSYDGLGSLYMTGGYIAGNMAFGSHTLTGNNKERVFIIKTDINGSLKWARQSIDTNSHVGFGIASYKKDIFLFGSLGYDKLIFDTNTITPTPQDNNPVFVIRYDSLGSVVGTSSLVSGGSYGIHKGNICLDKYCNFYVGGGTYKDTLFVASDSLERFGIVSMALVKASYTSLSCDAFPMGVVDQNKNSRGFPLFPNPNSGSFYLSLNELGSGKLVVYNSLGEVVHEQSVEDGVNTIQTEKLKAGIYHYVVRKNDQYFSSGKFLKGSY